MTERRFIVTLEVTRRYEVAATAENEADAMRKVREESYYFDPEAAYDRVDETVTAVGAREIVAPDPLRPAEFIVNDRDWFKP